MAINPKRKQYWFDKVCDIPGAWLAVAERLRQAADLIDFRPISFPKAAFGRNQIVFEQCL